MTHEDPAALARRQQRVEELCAAAIRALAQERDLHFRGRRLHRGRTALPLFAPHLHPSLEEDDFASFRGAADGLALRLAHSDAALHRRLAPEEAAERTVFEMLEQYRCEALAGAEHPGVQRNLQHRFEAWSQAFVRSRLTETRNGLLLYALAQVCRARVAGQPMDEQAADLIETTRGAMVPAIGTALAALRATRFDQAAYAAHALAVAHWAAARLRAGRLLELARGASAEEADERLSFGLRMSFDEGDEGDAPAVVVNAARDIAPDDAPAYRAFTTAYDREARAAALVRPDRLAELRAQLDRRLAAAPINVARLARELKALLAVPARDDWAGAQEEGLIDGRRLAQLVASPTERRLFKRELREPVADACVSFLVDCSGSMRTHAESVALLLDLFTRALDMAGATSEVLGFTTGAWNGGRAQRDWQRAGKPPNPGRLNELLHLVFKDAATPWRRARRDLAALLEGHQFREGVDGEAVAWAAARLAARPEARRVLVVLSDGCPMDAATQVANGRHFLDRHLQQVAAQVETGGAVELAALGLGLDLSPFYSRSEAVDLAAGPDRRTLQAVLALFDGRRGRR